MIIVTGSATFKPGAAAELGAEMEAMISASRIEPGCIDYRYGIDVLNPNEIVVLEFWENWEALDAHFAMPHMATWRAALAGKVISRDIKAFKAGEIRDL